MEILDRELNGRTTRMIKTEKNYLQEVYVDEKETMDVNGDENASAGRWEVVEVIQDLNSNRLHQEIICPDGLGSQDKNSDDAPATITDGTVTYRVVQVASDASRDDVSTAQIVTTSAALVGGQQVAQAIIANPFTTSNGGASPTPDGPFYVMMSPQDVLQTGQRTLAPRTSIQFSPKLEGSRTARDERRRATHNEVERRRRDKINNWIVKLSKIVPDCTSDHTKQGQGGILAKACDYIQELRASSARVPEVLKENERLSMDVEVMRQQCEELKNENQVLRAHLQQHGVTVTSLITNS